MQYEIRAMSFGEILDTSFALLRNHFVPLVGLSCIVAIPSSMAGAIFGSVDNVEVDPAQLIGAGVALLVTILLGPVIAYAITRLVCSFYQGQQATAGESLSEGARLYLPVVGTGLLAGLFILVGLLLFIIPGIYLMLALSLISPIMVLEATFGTRAISRSRELAKGSLLRIFGVGLVVMVLQSALNFAATMLTLSIPLVGGLMQGLVAAVTQTFYMAAMIVLYFDIRCRKEGFDLEHLSAMVAGQGQGAAPRPDPI